MFFPFKFVTSVVYMNKMGFIHPCRQSGVACILPVPKWQLSVGVREGFNACQRFWWCYCHLLPLG